MLSFNVRVAGGVLLWVLLFAPALLAEGTGLPASREPMIPPGQEQLLAEMLGWGLPLAGCTLTNAAVEYTIVKASYACPGDEVVFELAHPSVAPVRAIQTAQFALTLQSGSPPRALADAVVSLIRSREGAFEWQQPAGGRSEDDDAADED